MRLRSARRVSAAATLALLLAGAAQGMVHRVSPEAAAPRHAPDQLLVLFADSVLSPVEAVFDRSASFAEHTADRSPGLDELFRELGVRGVHPIIRQLAGREGAVPAAENLRAADEAMRSAQALWFPVRAARAPQGAVAPAFHHLYRLELAPGADVLAAAAAFAADPHVVFAEPNVIHEIAVLPNDRFVDPDRDGAWQSGSWRQPYADAWGLEATGWQKVWEDQAGLWPDAARRGGKGVVVAVIDTGVDVGHEDLAKNIWRDRAGRPGFDMVDIVLADYLDDGWKLDPAEDYTGPDFDPVDRHGHGTHVAGTVAAVAGNQRGIAGVAWASRVMPVRAGFQLLRGDQRYGLLETDDIIRGLDAAVAAGADVVNMSFGSGSASEGFAAAVARAKAAGVVLVASAGNANIDAQSAFPASFDGVVAVAAVGPDGHKAGFSNWGRTVDLSAPGVDVLSLRARDTTLSDASQVVAQKYIRASGTSMASPHAAGAAALLLSAFPRAKAQEIVARLTAGALSGEPETVSDGRLRWVLGAGRLDAARALTLGPGPSVLIAGHGIGRDASSDGVIDPGEEGTLRIVLRNLGRPLKGVRIGVVSLDPFATVTTGAEVRNLAQGGDLVLDFSFIAATPLRWGQANRFRVTLDAQAGGYHRELPVELALRGPRKKQGWPAPAVTQQDLSYLAPALADLDGDSHAEVVAVSVAGDVLGLRADGTPAAGWPVQLGQWGAFGGVNAADLDGDGRPEVVLSLGRLLYVLEHDGALRPGWPVELGSGLGEGAALGDLDGDGDLEVVVVEGAGIVHVLDTGGDPLPGWPRPLSGKAYAAPLLVDLDGGGLDVVVAAFTGSGLTAFHADGSLVAGWPSPHGAFIDRAGAAADLDGDGSPEIIAMGFSGDVQVFDARGNLLVRTLRLFDSVDSSPAVGDLDGDGTLEIVVGGDYKTLGGALYALSADGQVLPGWPVPTGSWVRTSPAIVDLDGDGAAEVVAGSLDGRLHALRGDGKQVPGWPFLQGDVASDYFALGDLDGDGSLEIVTTLSRLFTAGLMPIVGVVEFGEVAPGALPWPSARGGPTNPGAAQSP